MRKVLAFVLITIALIIGASSSVLAASEIKVNETISVSVSDNQTTYIKFVAEEPGLYVVYSETGESIGCELYDADKNLISYDCFTSGCDGYSFKHGFLADAKTTFYLGLDYYGDDGTISDKISIRLHKNVRYDDGKNETCTENGYSSGYFCEDCKEWAVGHIEFQPAHIDDNQDYVCDFCKKDITIEGFGYTLDPDGNLTIFKNWEIAGWNYLDWYSIRDVRKATLTGDVTIISSDFFKFCVNLEEITIDKTVVRIESIFGDSLKLRKINYVGSLEEFRNAYLLGDVNNYLGNAEIHYEGCNSHNKTKYKSEKIGCLEYSEGVYCEDCEGWISPIRVLSSHKDEQLDGLCDVCGESSIITTGYGGNNVTWLLFSDGGFTLKGKGVYSPLNFNDGSSSLSKYAHLVKYAIVPEGIYIGHSAFNGCINLEKVELPEGIEYIGTAAFTDCKKLEKVDIPQTVTSINDYAFDGCISLSDINIHENINNIGCAALRHCFALQSISIPNQVTTINESTFEECINLKSLFLPASIEDIGSSVFEGCCILSDVYYEKSEEYWNRISISKYHNECLSNATIHFNSTTPDSPEHTHTYTSAIIESATCKNPGVMLYSCYCGDSYKRMIPATGIHTGGTATCIEKAICSDCGAYYGDLASHVKKAVPGKKATCKEFGLTSGIECSKCGEILVEQEVISKTSHIGGTATCKAKAKCSVCGTEYGSLANHKETTLAAKSATYTSTGLTAGKKCSVCGKITVAQKTVAKLTLGKVSDLKAKKVKVAKSSEITLAWNKVTGAKSYEVYQKSGSKWKKIKTTSSTSYTVKKLKADKEYQFKVRAVVDGANGAYSSVLKIETIPETTSLKLKAGKKQLTASWSKVSDISGYEISYSTSKKFSKKTTKVVKAKKSSKKITIKKLTKNKKYYVRIRTYKTVNGKKIYSDWSTVKNVKVK